jgi:hypothetical protein
MVEETNFQKLEKELLGEEGFIIKLRMLDGFDELKFEKVCKVLYDFSIECKSKEQLPKQWVSLLVEICPSILIYMDNKIYCKDDEQWNVKIWDAYLRIYDLVLDCCF